MSYNNTHVEPHLKTAGKITILTTLFGVVGFLFIFLLNVGQTEFQTAQAQSTATTSVNVLNTPPEFEFAADEPIEEIESSATLPTNSGDEFAVIGRATDQNGAPYFLLICETNAATAQQGDGLGSTAPICTNGDQIAVSTSTVSGQQARAATTTTEAFIENNPWFAFACDDDAVNPECTTATYQGSGTGTSPFIVNRRPSFTGIANDGPVDPGGVLTYTATALDTDIEGVNDTVRLFVCVANDYNTTTNECGPGGTIASSSFSASNPAAATTTKTPYQDDTYDAFVFIVDNHGHEAAAVTQGTNEQYIVSNVAPTVNATFISLNGGDPIVVDEPAGEKLGFTLSFIADDANSCVNSGALPEITDYIASVYRSGIGSSTCDTTATGYNPNNCYPSAVGPAIWNISCAATTTPSDCSGSTDATQTWECTFPLWYVADATDAGSPFAAQDWRAAVAAIDDDGATTTIFTESATAGTDVTSFLSFALDTTEIPYGSLAPGDGVAGSTSINTTVRPTGNVGIDTGLSGLHMCPDTEAIGSCDNVASTTATSSIPEYQQQYSATTTGFTNLLNVITGGTPLATTSAELELNVPKSISTSSQPSGVTYWAIGIPDTISFAGLYTGRNTIIGITSEPGEW